MDWDMLLARYRAYWNRENTDRPLLSLFTSKGLGAAPAPNYASHRERWLDFDQVMVDSLRAIENTEYRGEAYPCINPNLGPDIFGAILGCDIEFGKDTSWAVHAAESVTELPDLRFDPDTFWYQQIERLTKRAVESAQCRYAVGVTDIHPAADALVSLVGPQNLCIDLMDEPARVQELIWQSFDAFKEVYTRLYAITKPTLHGGATNWLQVLFPDGGYVTSCDLICMLSTQDFRRFILPELEAELDFLPASLFHLDGPQALHHLDDLLALPRLNGIQWVPGAGAAPMRDWLPVLQKIQNAGKLLHLSIVPEDFEPLLRGLRPEGVYMACYCATTAEAQEMLTYAEAFYR